MIVDDEFASLIPALTKDEYQRLERSILSEGCRDAIVLWGDIIVDGHNRYKICSEHNIKFNTIQKEFASRDEVMLWMLQNQLARRNLNDAQRIEMVRKYEEAIKAKARERQGARTDLLNSAEQQLTLTDEDNIQVNLPECSQSRDELGAMASVSGSTYEHAVKVLDNAPASVVEAMRNDELSINAAYEVTKFPKEQQNEIDERITQGEKPRDVVSDIKMRAKKAKQTNSKDTAETDDTQPIHANFPLLLSENIFPQKLEEEMLNENEARVADGIVYSQSAPSETSQHPTEDNKFEVINTNEQAEIASRIEQGENTKKFISKTEEIEELVDLEASINQTELTDEQEAKFFFEVSENEEARNTEISDMEKLRQEIEASKKSIMITELLEGTETRWRIREEGKQDCILFIWVKPGEIQRLFYALFNGEEFKYKGIALVWSQAGEVKEICVVGTRGKAELPKKIIPSVIEATSNELDKRPDICENKINELLNE